MSSGYSGRRFQCPFFRWDEKRKIHCEGGVITLPNGEFTAFVERYCADIRGWRECSIARELNAYYARH